jgi:hypothetical protein
MTRPTHLWSGDWEKDSRTPPIEPTVPSSPPADEPAVGGRSSSRRLAAIGALVAGLIVVGVVLAVTLTGGSSKMKNQSTTHAFVPRPFNGSGGSGLIPTTTTPQAPTTTPQAQTTPQQTQTPAPVQVGPTYAWLGMQISDTPSGIAVATVTIGGAADTAGINPGDVITQVNSTAVGSVAQLRAAVDKLSVGDAFQLTVDRGSTPVTIGATLANRPRRQS